MNMKSNIFTTLLILLVMTASCTTSANRTNSGEIGNRDDNSTRLMSYNIRNAKGLDDVTDYDRIADVINRTSPDVIGIQELDSVTGRSSGVDVLDVLSRKTLMHQTYAASIDYDGGKYGIGVLSKEKPLSVKRVPLPGREEYRMLLIVEFEDYLFGNTHFSLNAEDRLESAKIINREAEKLNKPFFIVGDINAIPESDVLEELEKSFTSLVPHNQFTIPADNPTRTIDYIFGYDGVDGWSSLTDKGVIDESVASDHRPLFADIWIYK